MGQHRNIGPDTYAHLNDQDSVPFDIEATARTVIRFNYGLHRFLSAAIRELRKERGSDDEMASKLTELLRAGYF